MNFYKRFIGDIQRDTGHLSLAEFGAYDRLLDHYYATEAPLPLDVDACCRIARAMSKDERKAVSLILSQFFTVSDVGYIQKRAEKELAEAQPKIEANKLNGLKGGRPKGTKNKTQEKPTGFLNETQTEPNDNLSQSHSQKTTKLSNTQSNLTIVEPSKAASVCLVLKQNQILDVNPSHPTLIALLDAGATVEEFENLAKTIKVKKFNYLLSTLKNMREDALSTTYAKGKVEPKEDLTWRNDDNKILLKAQSLKIHTQGRNRFEILAAIDAKREAQRAQA